MSVCVYNQIMAEALFLQLEILMELMTSYFSSIPPPNTRKVCEGENELWKGLNIAGQSCLPDLKNKVEG